MSGWFITFEGIDKSGKTTQARLLAETLREAGYGVVLTHEPGATELGSAVRGLALDRPWRMPLDPLAEMFLFAADRAQHVAEVIRPALAEGKVVVCDRFMDSTLAYQGYGRGQDLGDLEAVQAIATGGLRPDLTVLVDVDVPTARQRAGAPSDRMEASTDPGRVRDGFVSLHRAEPGRILLFDGSQEVGVLAGRIREEVLRRFRP